MILMDFNGILMRFQSDETTNTGDIMGIFVNLCNGQFETWDEWDVCQFDGNIMRYNAIYLNCIYQQYDDPP